jgi:hypothetical protein
MLVDTPCPQCHFRCTFNDASHANYVRCSCCRHVFPIAAPAHAPPPLPPARRRRRKPFSFVPLFVFAALLCLALGIVTVVKNLRREKTLELKVTQENFTQLRVGMKEREAFRILGVPSRTDNSMAPHVDVRSAHRFSVNEDRFDHRCFWEEEGNLIWIEFSGELVKDFGCTIDGQQVGREINESLAKERQILDDD